jgi:hypothetical protein
MAILGENGRLRLRRETPEVNTVVPADRDAGSNSFQLTTTGILTGDQVTLAAAAGVPYSGTPTSLTAFAYVDQLNRISFYSTFSDAVNGATANRLVTSAHNFVTMTFTAINIGWEYVCDIRSWSLELDAASIDTTPLGTRFGEAIKSVVTGGGTLDYLIERRTSAGFLDPVDLMRLVLLTEVGSRATAQFWVLAGRASSTCADLAPGDIYYEADILLTSTSINTAADTIIAASSQFVSDREVRLKVGTN